MFESKDHHYVIKMKDILVAINLTPWYLIDFFIKKIYNIDICFKIFNIKNNPVKNSIKEEILLIFKINLEFEI